MNINVPSGNYTLSLDANSFLTNTANIYLQCQTGSGAVNVILPRITSIEGITTTWGFKIYINDVVNNAATHNITITPHPSDKINGTLSTPVVLNTNGVTGHLQVVGINAWEFNSSLSSGTSGFSGYSGFSGLDGIASASGYSGFSGKSGFSGYSGLSGYSGFSGFSGAIVPSSAQFVRSGSQPATVGAGQPFTYTTEVLSSADVVATTAVFNPPFTTSGTVFKLVSIGRYEINYQMVYPTDGGVVLYFGATVVAMSPLAYSIIGKTPDGAVSGSVIVDVVTPNSFVSVNAAAGNAAAIAIPPNSSTTNTSATTVSFKKIS